MSTSPATSRGALSKSATSPTTAGVSTASPLRTRSSTERAPAPTPSRLVSRCCKHVGAATQGAAALAAAVEFGLQGVGLGAQLGPPRAESLGGQLGLLGALAQLAVGPRQVREQPHQRRAARLGRVELLRLALQFRGDALDLDPGGLDLGARLRGGRGGGELLVLRLRGVAVECQQRPGGVD